MLRTVAATVTGAVIVGANLSDLSQIVSSTHNAPSSHTDNVQMSRGMDLAVRTMRRRSSLIQQTITVS